MTPKLALMPVVDRVDPMTPAAFREAEAALYLRVNIHTFRRLVHRGVIPYVRHVGGARRLYARTDLDEYLRALVRCRMPEREVSPTATEEKPS